MYPPKLKNYGQYYFYERYEFCRGNNELVNIYLHRNYNIGMHCHDFYEINIILNGDGCHYIGEMAIPISGGEVFVIPPNVAHGYFCKNELHVFHILLKNNFIEKYREDLENVPCFSTLFEIEPFLRQVYNNFMYLSLSDKQLSEISDQLNHITKYSEPKYLMHQTLFTVGLLNRLCILMEKQKNKNENVQNENTDIVNVLEYIQSHYNEKITIDDLTKISNMSRPTLHRHFKKITKMTPMEYIISIRVAAAKNLLSDTEKSRTEIAHNLGFYDTSHMNKHLYGMNK